MRWLAPFLIGVLFASPGFATWSIVAVDRITGQLVIASATCVSQARFATFPAEGLMDIPAVVVPGKGIAAAQARVDRTRANQTLISEELRQGTAPIDMLSKLREDPDIERRQFGIVDVEGRSAGHSGTENGEASLDVQGRVSGTDIVYSIQGNILASDDVIHDAVTMFEKTEGNLADRVMAAMEAADAAGGDRRCRCETEPLTEARCDGKSEHVAYILGSDATTPESEPTLYIDVTDENIEPHENPNPIKTLRTRYDAREP